ncbi:MULTISPECIES: hypothetical protein [Streptomyces]|uniref:Uncharacterized protein n=1 Tax=Streptomyces tsukubensis (strain DSM 42081 / NBRC 108919 / NRRL 18488 / 9993) TaxID=1114943 RepID=I2MUQ8_STRT9|nr:MULTISPECIES: hypothetical protein [Streptomyces]EIF88505.1 hypothetical protein [Streptomyces tsukubensis NRRL18488]MYS67092.1 hypothetical protein [Streptomyces sp. SID5473]QKM70820.1 hypothetical protein STSU_030510 [Streptomyces tsukubensis NRRL18488]TAI41061.1 hypothetical protein EWI31_29335 [Streptomyces tsukubensis]
MTTSSVTSAALPPGGFGNGIFRAYVNGRERPGAGEFTVLTGEENPAGPGRDVLYGRGIPGTSFLRVADLGTGRVYVQGQLLTHSDEVSLDASVQSVRVSGAESVTRWSVSDSFDLEQRVTVSGTTAADSRVTVTTRITDVRTERHRFRIEYLWDTAVAGDDGPVVQSGAAGASFRPFDPVHSTEQTFDRSTGELAVADQYANPGSPTFAVAVSGTGTAGAVPDRVQYVCLAEAVFAPIGGYVTDPARDISSPASDCRPPAGGPDSGLLLLWSRDAAQDDATVAAVLRMSPANPYASTLRAGPVSLGTATATLTDTATGRPVPGRTVVFTSGGRVRCRVVTDGAGRATCDSLLGGLLGYDVDFAGDAIWAAAHGHGGLPGGAEEEVVGEGS